MLADTFSLHTNSHPDQEDILEDSLVGEQESAELNQQHKQEEQSHTSFDYSQPSELVLIIITNSDGFGLSFYGDSSNSIECFAFIDEICVDDRRSFLDGGGDGGR
ncbi:hypothetical protein AKJ16_DCAP24679 [Drosera capensis]